jgi:hypothetical protein
LHLRNNFAKLEGCLNLVSIGFWNFSKWCLCGFASFLFAASGTESRFIVSDIFFA